MSTKMAYDGIALPANGIWSSPFVRWGGSLAGISSLDVAVAVTSGAVAARGFPIESVDGLVLGWTVPQAGIFYGAPTVAARLGMPGVSGPMVSQACGTSVAALTQAAGSVQAGSRLQMVVTADRMSNGPTLAWPGQGGDENWILDNLARDPSTGLSTLATAETVAAECGFQRADADSLAVLRSAQYESHLRDRAYYDQFLIPIEVDDPDGTRVRITADEGVRRIETDVIAGLPTSRPGGVHTAASQTHPADASAGALVTSVDSARAIADGQGIVRLRSSGHSRVAPAHMPQALVPAAAAALDAVGLSIDQVHEISTHNPFAVNDLYFARETGVRLEDMNRSGCSLIFGHPQAPTGLRSLAHVCAALRNRGGGIGLYTGCTAGDSGMAVVVEVTD